MGNGNCFSGRKLFGVPLPGSRDFAYGICECPLMLVRAFIVLSAISMTHWDFPKHPSPSAVARPDRVRRTLGARWAGRDPEPILDDPSFYTDILRRCHQVEMTLMLLTSRPLALAGARPAVEGALRRSMERLGGGGALGQADAADLAKFIGLFDGEWTREREIKNYIVN